MKKKTLFMLAIMMALIVPAVQAVWWNPFTWDIFNIPDNITSIINRISVKQTDNEINDFLGRKYVNYNGSYVLYTDATSINLIDGRISFNSPQNQINITPFINFMGTRIQLSKYSFLNQFLEKLISNGKWKWNNIITVPIITTNTLLNNLKTGNLVFQFEITSKNDGITQFDNDTFIIGNQSLDFSDIGSATYYIESWTILENQTNLDYVIEIDDYVINGTHLANVSKSREHNFKVNGWVVNPNLAIVNVTANWSYLSRGMILNLDPVFEDNTQAEFNSGFYNRTFFNSTESYLQLNKTNKTGNFTSQVFDATASATWNNISWFTEVAYQTELPNISKVDSNRIEINNYVVRLMNMTGLVLLMNLNNNTNDSSGLSNHGVPFNSANCGTTNEGQFGTTACQAYGTTNSDYIGIRNGASVTGLSQMSVSFWVKWDSVNAQTVIFHEPISSGSGSARWTVWLKTGPELEFGGRAQDTDIFTSWVNTLFLPIANRWYHIIATWEGNTDTDVYIDTVNYDGGSPTAASFTASDPQDIRIGEGSGGGNDGQFVIDEVAIFNRSLSLAEVKDIYKRGALRLNLSVQSCDDNQCSGESFRDYTNTSTSINLTEVSNRYFQYRFNLNRTDGNYTPQLYNVTIDYTLVVEPPAGINQCDIVARGYTLNCNENCLNMTQQNLKGNKLIINSTNAGTFKINITNYTGIHLGGGAGACKGSIYGMR